MLVAPLLLSRFPSGGPLPGEGVANAYDTLGRLQSSTLDMDGTARTLTYTLDAGGRRTQLSWPDARETSFSWDDAGRMQAIFQGALGSTADLWTYSYSDHGRRVRKTARHGQYAEGLADGLGRLTSLHTELAGADNDNDTVFTYNPASQVASRAISNDAYAWTDHANAIRNYDVNGLNQYEQVGQAPFEYDPNGNLTGDPGSASGAAGVAAYLYDIENRLVRATSGAVTHTLLYDPLGRLYQIGGAGAGVVRFLYDGDELVAEYNGGGTLLRRYVHGAGVDDPLIWYEGADFGDQRWLFADHQGSIVAVTKGAPVLGLNSYDEYGNPATGNLGRFQYTGQAWLPELGMYHYKSRLYSPRLGRFMQTDPIGYEDQINLYAYVGNDPVNMTDPTGMYECETKADCKVASDGQKEIRAARDFYASNRPGSNIPRSLEAAGALNKTLKSLGSENDGGVNIKEGVPEDGARGQYDSRDNTITLSSSRIAGSGGTVGGTLAHETQHYRQRDEGLSRLAEEIRPFAISYIMDRILRDMAPRDYIMGRMRPYCHVRGSLCDQAIQEVYDGEIKKPF